MFRTISIIIMFYVLGCSTTNSSEQPIDSLAAIYNVQSAINSDSLLFRLQAMDKGWRLIEVSGAYSETDTIAQHYIQEFILFHRLDLDANYTYTIWEPDFRYRGKWKFDYINNLLLLMDERGNLRDTFYIDKFTADTLIVSVFVGEGLNRQKEKRIYIPI